jgi:putative membrane protein
MNHPQKSVWQGAAAGLIGGLVAAWTMNQFQALLSKTSSDSESESDSTSDHGNEGDDATQKTAAALAEPILERKLTKEEKQTAGPAVHYAFGATMGAFYGALAEAMPSAALGRGLTFGAGLWFGADEVAVPALGFAPPPSQTPVSTHVSALAAHLVYGLTTDLVRRTLRGTLSTC